MLPRWIPALIVLAMLPASGLAQASPDDDRMAAQWYLDALGARGLAEQGIDGEGVIIAVLDSGIDHTHPDLAGRLWANEDELPGNGLDDDLNGYVDDVAGWDACHDAPVRPRPVHYHGTFVAGVAAADGRGHNGVLGLAPAATIMDVQAFCDDNAFAPDEGPLDPDAVREALAYAIDNGAHIIQLSMQGWPDHGPSAVGGLLQQYAGLQEEFQRAYDAGILVVAAAGNKGAVGPASPADRAHVFSVGATTGCGPRHSYSNHGPAIGIWAPGRALSTTIGGYGWDTGTSFAAPMVSGTAALLLQNEPGLSPDAIRQRLLDAAVPTEDGPGLDLRAIFGGAPLPAPGPLRHAGRTAVGDLHYLQFQSDGPAPLLHVKIQGAGEWCIDNATSESLWVRVAQLPQPAQVSARLHNGFVPGPWLNLTFTLAPDRPDTEERPLLTRAVDAPIAKQSPAAALWIGFGIALMLRRR